MINYFLGDAARIRNDFDDLKSLNPQFKCLYFGKSEEQLSTVAPYIFACNNASQFVEQVIIKGWGNSWGLFIATENTIEEALHHFRKFLMVKTENGQQLYFRFYDPRVLRIFLPTCDEEQLSELFGLVKEFICEDEDPRYALVFFMERNRLATKRVEAVTLFPVLDKPGDHVVSTKEKEAVTESNNEITIELKANRPARRFFD